MEKMRVLLLGSGGREHAFSWKLKQSRLLSELFISPGNAGTMEHGQNIALDILDNEAIISFCQEKSIDLVIVGPEAPLVNGLHNAIKDDPRTTMVKVIGPKSEGARLEGSKDFSKQFMNRHAIPTALYQTFDSKSLEAGYAFLEELNPPYVLKCDGLAAGKGVLILDTLEEAKSELKNIVQDGSFGQAGAKVVVEEFLEGTELSCFILTDGKGYLLLPTAKDYKRIGEGDTGLNTGGMGALSPAPVADETFMERVKEKVINRTISGLQQDGIDYSGFIFIGLMRVADEPYVIEYNVRMGDPETEAVLPRIESDLLSHFIATAEGRLEEEKMNISEDCCATVMMVSGGYPKSYEKGKEIVGLDEIDESSIVFHAGTKSSEGGRILTNGGRVLTVSSSHKRMLEAVENSYKNLEKITFDSSYYRRDIGYELREEQLR